MIPIMEPPKSAVHGRYGLIAISAPELIPWELLEGRIAEALEAGLPAVMIRDRGTPDRQLRPIAGRIRDRAHSHGAALILNRRLDLARGLQPDAVHLGKEGPTIAAARSALGSAVRIGYSAHGITEALAAFDAGADYVFLSPIFDTPSKQGVLEPLGLQPLAELVAQAPGPVIALGGIDPDNAAAVLATGAAGLAMIRGILAVSGDPVRRTKQFLELIRAADSRRHRYASRPPSGVPDRQRDT